MPLDSGVPRRFPSRALEQSPGRLLQDAGLQQDIKDLADGRDRGPATRFRRLRPFDGPEIRAGDRASGRRRVVPEAQFSRHPEKRASLCGRHVSELLPAVFAMERQVERRLFPVREQVVQPVDFRPGIRQPPARRA